MGLHFDDWVGYNGIAYGVAHLGFGGKKIVFYFQFYKCVNQFRMSFLARLNKLR